MPFSGTQRLVSGTVSFLSKVHSIHPPPVLCIPCETYMCLDKFYRHMPTMVASDRGTSCPRDPCAPPVYPTPYPLANTGLLSFSRMSDGITRCVALSGWLLSLSQMRLRVLHEFAWPDGSFFFSTASYSTVWAYHSVLSITFRGPSWLPEVSAMVNKAAVNIHVLGFVWT